MSVCPSIKKDKSRRICAACSRKQGCRVNYNPHGLSREKDWDIIVNDIPIEIKMATIGKDGRNFQHERLVKSAKFEALILIDIAPHDIYVSCYDYEELDGKKCTEEKTVAFINLIFL